MIRTVGELLEELVKFERENLARQSALVEHPTIIGDMYEGLTREVTGRALLEGLDLRVVRGKLKNSKGEMSRQIDCMVVSGDGERIPYTEHWIYPVERAVAVIEVKKNLWGAGLADSVDLLADLQRRICEPKAMPQHLFRDAWRGIRGTELPEREQLSTLSMQDQLLFHFLLAEANLPLRVVFGFEGYNSEASLRKGLTDLLRSRIEAGQVQGIGPLALPNLIIARSASLLKLTGMPYQGPFFPETSSFGVYGSQGSNPLNAFLEMLWTRFHYYMDVSADIFGVDLDREQVHLLLRVHPIANEENLGWKYEIFDATEEELITENSTSPWEPAILSNVAFTVVNLLCNEEEVRLDDPEFSAFLAKRGSSQSAVVDELARSRLAYVENGAFRLLTDQCACAIVPGVGFVAGENATGRFSRWLEARLASRRGAPDKVEALRPSEDKD